MSAALEEVWTDWHGALSHSLELNSGPTVASSKEAVHVVRNGKIT